LAESDCGAALLLGVVNVVAKQWCARRRSHRLPRTIQNYHVNKSGCVVNVNENTFVEDESTFVKVTCKFVATC